MFLHSQSDMPNPLRYPSESPYPDPEPDPACSDKFSICMLCTWCKLGRPPVATPSVSCVRVLLVVAFEWLGLDRGSVFFQEVETRVPGFGVASAPPLGACET